jgi:hypothetical protein
VWDYSDWQWGPLLAWLKVAWREVVVWRASKVEVARRGSAVKVTTVVEVAVKRVGRAWGEWEKERNCSWSWV